MKRKFSLSLITTALLLTSTAVFANTSKSDTKAYVAQLKSGQLKKEISQKETDRLHKVVNDMVSAHKASLKKAPKEFMSALNDTIMALRAIKTDKADEAQKLLKKAENEFAAAFKKEPKLGMIPVLDNAEIITFNGTPALIRHIKNAAIELLQDNDTQVAIDMLIPLQDEIIIKTQYVPAYLYPKAVKEAQKELKAGKKEAAFSTIITVLDASQLDTVIIPIPLLTAQDIVLQASKLAKKDKKEALKLLDMAQIELQKAVLLGYAHEYQKGYKDLDKKIEAIKTEIKGKNVVAKLYDDLLKSFKDLGKKHHDNKSK